MIPIRTDYRMSRTPWVNYALVATNVLVFVLGYHGMSPEGRAKINALMLYPNTPLLHQFFTSVFLHADWGHLLGNMLFLWVFGNAMNDRFGHVGYLAFYLTGGVLAGLGYVLVSSNAPVLGASGAIAAVTGAYLVLLPRARVTVLFFFLYILAPVEVSSLVFLMFQFIWNLWMMPELTGAPGGGVAYAAHVAGYVYGIAMAVILLATKILPRDAYDLLNLIRNSRRRGRYRRMVAQGYDPFGHIGHVAGPPRRKVRVKSAGGEAGGSVGARELELRRDIAKATARHDLPGAAARYLELVQIVDGAVLPRQQQLDVANQLMSSNQHPAAADAYERFIKHHAAYEHIADIYLMLGLIYCRYLDQNDRAERNLEQAVRLLTDPEKIELAKSDLAKIRQDRST